MRDRTPKLRTGLTLIEVLLAMALVAVIMVMLGSVIRSQMRMMDTRRTGIQEAQLARTVLRMIGNDLRAAVNVEREADSGTGFVSDEEATLADEDAGTTTDDSADAESSQAIDPLLQTAPGLYGSQSELRFDIVRSPRAQLTLTTDQVASASQLARPYSGFQSIGFYVGPAPENMGGIDAIVQSMGGTSSVSSSTSSTATASTGLIRQVMDQAARAYALEFGDLTVMDAHSQLIAPEVVAVEFQYYDGTQWWSEWDSAQQGGLPVAVEVAVAIKTMGLEDDDDASALSGLDTLAQGDTSDNVYRTLVYLPTSWKTDQNDQAY